MVFAWAIFSQWRRIVVFAGAIKGEEARPSIPDSTTVWRSSYNGSLEEIATLAFDLILEARASMPCLQTEWR